MGYTSAHSAHEFMTAACLFINHEYILACRGKSKEAQKQMVLGKREIDFNSRLALFFGPEASIAAQGTSDKDLIVSSPTIRTEIKYLRRKSSNKQPTNPWSGPKGIKHDWEWLLKQSANGNEFKKMSLVFFLPSKQFLKFHEVCSIAVPSGGYKKKDYAPFVRLVQPSSKNIKRLAYVSNPVRDLILNIQGKVKVRRQIVGSLSDPIWALVFSRVGTKEFKKLTEYDEGSI
jgi:hypothetical protein